MRRFFWLLPVWLIFGIGQVSAQTSETIATDSWEKTKSTGSGNVAVYWYTSRPFIFANEAGEVDGIEFKIMEGFKAYLKNQHNISLNIKWIESNGFIDAFYDVRDLNQNGTFGTSAFSITPERKNQVEFSPAYMPDISVMVSSSDVPIVNEPEKIKEVFSGLTAITIKGTTYESDILRMKEDWNVDFKIQYIPSNDNILRYIAEREKTFGFIDLPIYLIEFNRNTSSNVKRQNLLPIKREGYAVIYPKSSDWGIPIHEYFNSSGFRKEMETITSEYLDNNLYKFIEALYLNAEKNVVLLTKEKEIQYNELQGKAEKLRREYELRNYLILAVFIIGIFMIITFLLYRRVTKDNKVLSGQAEKIVSQSRNIERQKEQLEIHNRSLTELNNEKNILIKVLAHDLRSPINQIQGLANILLMVKKDMDEEQCEYIRQIADTAVRVNGMIGKILDVDALESERLNVVLEDVDVAKLIRQVVNSFQKEAEKKNINLYFYNSASGSCNAHLDRLYFTQVVENLISNALKFSRSKTNVKVSISSPSDKILLTISDEGPGFTDDDKKFMFQKFKQLSARPTNGEKSTGLGLSIVKKYVELMGGKVWCESSVGEGASFHIELNKSIVQ